MRLYPGPDRAFGDVDVEAVADRALRVAYGVAEVIEGNRFENRALRIGFVFSCGCGEFVKALCTLKYLKNPEAVLSPAFLDGGL